MRPTRVVHVSSAHRWTDNRIHLREAASLARHGYDVHLVAIEDESVLPPTGVTVQQVARRGRLARMTLGTVVAFGLALRTRAHIVHLHDPELVWTVLPLRALGRTVIFDAHEDLPNQILVKDYLAPRARRLLSRLARIYVWLASRSNHIVAATDAIAVRFPTHKVSVVKNYPVLRQADQDIPVLADREPRAVYTGAMTTERGALVMVESFAVDLMPSGWRLSLAGSISPAELVTRMQESPGWNSVDYVGVVSPIEARDMLHRCRIGLVLSQRNVSYLESLPTKMFEFFAAGMPVIASDFPLWRAMLEEHDCGVLVDEASPEEVARAIRRYADHPALMERHGRNAAKAARDAYSWQSEEATLLRIYRELDSQVSAQP